MNPAEPLITFTDAAVTHIQKMMNNDEHNIGFRLAIKKTGCSGYAYVPDIITKVNPQDLAFDVQLGLKVFVDTASIDFLKGIHVDFVAEESQGLKQKRLVFINPKEKGRCGCGESFVIE